MKLVSIVIAVGASLASLVTAMPESTLAIMNTANTASSFLDDKKIDNYQLVSILEAAAASTNAANVEDITQRLIALMDARMEAKAIKGLVESSMQQLELLGAREEEIAKVLEEVSIGEETVQVLQDLLMVSDEQQKYVDLHNKIRRQHNITAKFSWDRSLER